MTTEGWLQFQAAGNVAAEFFGTTESPSHVPSENRIGFRAKSPADVDSIAAIAAPVDARNIEGPMDYAPGYYAVFFEDPTGNRLELCHRLRPRKKFR
jgi:Glyoxalase/Bleomycin resistance protein/Dioxygenase superfamily